MAGGRHRAGYRAPLCLALALALFVQVAAPARAEAAAPGAMPALPRPAPHRTIPEPAPREAAPREAAPSEAAPADAVIDAESARHGLVACDPALVARHNPGLVAVSDELACFRGWLSNFDGPDDDDGDGVGDLLRLPHWVAQRVARAAAAPESGARPSRWFTLPRKARAGEAPTDDSYRFSRAFRAARPEWFERGHLGQKYLLEREGPEAAWFSHNLANAVPQLGRFNRGPWLRLECLTGAWANRYGELWVVAGPVFVNARPTGWLHQPGSPGSGTESGGAAAPVAIPDALFKLLARSEAADGGALSWRLLAFVYPQSHYAYDEPGEGPPERWLTSLARLEALTGQVFLPGLPEPEAAPLKRAIPRTLWPVARADFDPGCRRFAEDRE